jgi:phosphoribosylaminoimidazolecarboxamide formyltransferase/IMP cyclohydrolase
MSNAIISVSDKKGLDILVPHLEKNNYTIYSTGSTYKHIASLISNTSKLCLISEFTKSPEICEGRVKTLHPKIFGGILGDREKMSHYSDICSINGVFFDLVVVNLYPFQKKYNETEDENILLENIDIGGHSLIRAAIKNYKYVSVLTSPYDYLDYISGILNNKNLASIAIRHILEYDNAINSWFNDEFINTYSIEKSMKYGLNPYMKPSNILSKNNKAPLFEIINGQPSYINMLDCENAIKLVLEASNALGGNFCASFKHTSPAGVGKTFIEARNIDPKSSFGDIIGFSGTVDEEMAREIKKIVSDGIIAYDYSQKAIEILKEKKKGNYLVMKQQNLDYGMQMRDVNGVTLMQPSNHSIYVCEDEKIPLDIRRDISLGYITLKYTQSNSVCFVYDGKVIGIGAGQQNRVDCVKIAGEKAIDWMDRNNVILKQNLILVSDAFFPFKDNVEVARNYGVSYIVQPGGSIRDDEIIARAKELGIKMILNNMRVFTH